MKITLSIRAALTMAVVSMSANAFADYASTVLNDKPVCYFRLDESQTSGTVATNLGSLGSAANGTYSATGIVPDTTGALTGGGSADPSCGFDGVHGNILVPYSSAFGSPTFSFEAWAFIVKTNPPNYETVLNERVTSPQAGFTLYAVPTVPGAWQFWMGTGSAWSTIGAASFSGITNAWTHLVGTYDGTNQAFYINGNLVKLVAAKYNPNTSGALQIGIGGSVASPVYPFTTNIDEVAVYTNALSPAQVAAHYLAATGAAPAPVIPNIQLFGPVAQTNYAGENAAVSVTAGGSLPLAYQWSYSSATNNGPGTPIVNATNSTLVISNLSASLAYWVIITNTFGSCTSSVAAWVQVVPLQAPAITSQPQPEILYAGGTTHFAAAVAGAAPDEFSYQWQFGTGGVFSNITGATNAVLSLTNVTAAAIGNYQVVVGDAAGTNSSSSASLNVLAAPASKSYPATILADKAVAYWRLGVVDQTNGGSTAYDLAGGFNGTYNGPVELGQPGAITNDPDSFSTTFGLGSTYVAVPYATNINSSPFSVELWANDNGQSWSYYRSPLADHNPAGYTGFNFYGVPGNTWAFWGGNAKAWSTLSGPAVQSNVWTHLVATYDGTNLNFFVNGSLVSSVAVSYVPNNVAHLLIGCAGSDTAETYFWSGGIGEVAIYQTALSPAQIASHYSIGTGITKLPPVITVQPAGGSILTGSNITLSVQASGTAPLRYQWQMGGANIIGQTNSTLPLTDVTVTNATRYAVIITNGFGSVTSSIVNVIAVSASVPYTNLVFDDGAVGFWPLSETNSSVAENLGSAGSVDNGQYNAVTLGIPGPIAGASNTCAGFNASAQSAVNVPYDQLFNGQSFTVEAWAQMTGDGSPSDPGYPDQAVYSSRDSSIYGGLTLYGVYGGEWLAYTGTGSGWDVLYTGVPVSGGWTHLAFSYDGLTKSIYVNGKLTASSTGAFLPNQLDAVPERIGGGDVEVAPGAYFFEGNIGNVAVYNTCLPAASIQAHYAVGSVVPVSAQPAINISISAGSVILTWTGGTLQQTTNLVGGGWSAVPNAVSPLNLGAPTNGASFFRVMQ